MTHRSYVGMNNPNWKGGSIIEPSGRVLIRVGARYIYRYRLIMEKHLGRKLHHKEVVHHINGIVNDDRIENLQLTSQSQHAHFHGINASPETNKKKGRSGRDNAFFGKKHSEETKKKLSIIAKKRKVHPRQGVTLSKETRHKISMSLKKYNANKKNMEKKKY